MFINNTSLQKKLELAEKVKNQLRTAGVEARVESGDESDPECIKPDTKIGASRTVTAIPNVTSSRPSDSETEKIPSAKYYDLDKVTKTRNIVRCLAFIR